MGRRRADLEEEVVEVVLEEEVGGAHLQGGLGVPEDVVEDLWVGGWVGGLGRGERGG